LEESGTLVLEYLSLLARAEVFLKEYHFLKEYSSSKHLSAVDSLLEKNLKAFVGRKVGNGGGTGRIQNAYIM
jgi:hypothetical protein